ncbi:MAG TPA: ABC transporter permease subunit, partial [Candidatus Thalassarchaeaceae archaeon]|nr:ABC transporter permease subunit [Candidatus Thalassarchaeaceae archaeon]
SIVLCTVIGIIVGVMRLSNHKLSSGFGTVYVEIFRNMPLALLLFTISITVGNTLPNMADEFDIAGTILLSNQGIFTPAIDPGLLFIAILVPVLAKAYTTYADRDGFDDSDEGVRTRFRMWVGVFAVATAISLSNGWDVPTIWKRIPASPGSWVVEGGFEITLPFICIIAGLTIYTSAIVAEIVRGSIQSLPRGQIEAGISLGLTPFQRLRLVIMPQALRSMVPALNNQYMNVWKNSSLAMVVAYNDIFYINLVIVNKIGKAVPTFILILITYQVGSLVISAIMNLYNRRVTRVQI